jgi:DNA-nicking Smr family endonuclease
MEYDNYFKQGQSEEEQLRDSINEKYAKIRQLYQQGRI